MPLFQTLCQYKFDFLQEVCQHEHFIPLCLPIRSANIPGNAQNLHRFLQNEHSNLFICFYFIYVLLFSYFLGLVCASMIINQRILTYSNTFTILSPKENLFFYFERQKIMGRRSYTLWVQIQLKVSIEVSNYLKCNSSKWVLYKNKKLLPWKGEKKGRQEGVTVNTQHLLESPWCLCREEWGSSIPYLLKCKWSTENVFIYNFINIYVMYTNIDRYQNDHHTSSHQKLIEHQDSKKILKWFKNLKYSFPILQYMQIWNYYVVHLKPI